MANIRDTGKLEEVYGEGVETPTDIQPGRKPIEEQQWSGSAQNAGPPGEETTGFYGDTGGMHAGTDAEHLDDLVERKT